MSTVRRARTAIDRGEKSTSRVRVETVEIGAVTVR